MTRNLTLKVWLVSLVLGLSLIAVPAQAAGHNHYGEKAKHVANEIGCLWFEPVRTAPHNMSAGACILGNRAVYVMTFRNASKQRAWFSYARKRNHGDFFIGWGKGAVAFNKPGKKPAAKAAARVLPGRVRNLS